MTTYNLTEIDRYIEQLCVPANADFEQALRDATAAGLPEINVSPNEGKLLYLLAKIAGARRIIEIGLLGSYSAMWLASALPADGRLVTLEVNEKFAGVACKNLERAGLLPKVTIRVGDARLSLAELKRTGEPAFDLVFIDADKPLPGLPRLRAATDTSGQRDSHRQRHPQRCSDRRKCDRRLGARDSAIQPATRRQPESGNDLAPNHAREH